MLITYHCVGCRQCRPYCPVGAIVTAPDGRRSTVDQDKCVECGACLRAAVCPVNAVVRPELTYPRTLRSVFSDVTSPHKSTGVLGRGTEEMKTNDVTGRLRAHRVNVSVELGRPGISASFADVEVLSRAIAAFGVHFQEENPVTHLMTDAATGQLRPEILGERVLSALIEFDVAEERAPALVAVLKEAADKIDTVFSVGMAVPLQPAETSAPLYSCLQTESIFVRPNGKTNVGLGRPFEEVTV